MINPELQIIDLSFTYPSCTGSIMLLYLNTNRLVISDYIILGIIEIFLTQLNNFLHMNNYNP